jgi:hypothetical protein
LEWIKAKWLRGMGKRRKGQGNGIRPVIVERKRRLSFSFALRLSLCSLGFFAPHVFCGALPSEPKAPADAVAA